MESSMTSMNISLPESLRKFVETQVAKGGYGSTSEYLRELIRNDQKEKAAADLEEKLLSGLRSPTREWTEKDWDALRRRLEKRLAKRGGPAGSR
jgi:antitoxin ParD1/3/4